MAADNGPQNRDPDGASGISRPEVLLGVGGVAAAICRAGRDPVIRTARTRFDDVDTARKDVNIGVAPVPAFVFARLVALMALIVLPAGAVVLANDDTFEGVTRSAAARAVTGCCRWSTTCGIPAAGR